uniref:Uncharacterized protein n=1 Tax=Arundo donax TaxID=35708 RepID=A0A0A8ZJC7_ARUDO
MLYCLKKSVKVLFVSCYLTSYI